MILDVYPIVYMAKKKALLEFCIGYLLLISHK